MLLLVCCKSTTGGCKTESEEHKDMRKVYGPPFAQNISRQLSTLRGAMKKKKKNPFTSRLEETCTALHGAGIGTV